MNLTKRQTEIVEHLAAGETADEIAAAFSRSVLTVRTQIKQACQRVGARNIANLVALSLRNGWIHLVVALLISTLVMPTDEALRAGARRLTRKQEEIVAIV
ncbi:MAG: LuxR C-terminal-related transcriptional regulator [Halomonas sp.]|nr:LuxR C-terminal-related transcriptional regulator [Halomonas sp.]